MEYEKLLELIKTVSESNITGFLYETGDTKIMISTVESGLAGATAITGTCKDASVVAEGTENVASAVSGMREEAVGQVSGQTTSDEQLAGARIVKSPLVGTFYTAPSEESPAFVNVGDHVKAGQTLAIVEAMKLMNEIESEFEGTITRIFVKNGDCVEYGQPLFAIS